MKKIRTAVIGLGRIGWQFHLPKITAKEGFELVAVVDKLDERLEEAVEKYDIDGYSDYKQMLFEQKPDLVVVASPTPFHKEQTLASFEHGCDVFCEKPAALNLDEYIEMREGAKKFDRKFMVYQPYRATVETLSLQSILQKGLIGEVYMIRRNWFEYTRRNDWQSLKKYGGGMLNNYGAHFVDQLLYLSDYKASDINCVTRNLISVGDAEDFVKILIETAAGTLLDIEINLACPQPLPCWQILGRYGSIIPDEENQGWQVKYCEPERIRNIEVERRLAAEGRVYRKDSDIEWKSEFVSLSDFEPIDYYDKCYEYYALDAAPFVPAEHTFELMRTLGICDRVSKHLSVINAKDNVNSQPHSLELVSSIE
ncbi:MAG: Gfo/Idh/MocA family protein [Sedimentisphaeraceae bacterium JB056]